MMLGIHLLIFALLGQFVYAAPKIAHLVGGHDADFSEYPWQVMIKYEIFFLCSGSILDEYNILTAAHCLIHDPVQRYGNFSIVAGEYDTTKHDGTEQERLVESVVIHEGFVMDSLYNDVAVIRLTEPLDLSSEAVKPIGALSYRKFDRLAAATPEKCFMSGWGMSNDETREFPNILQEIQSAQIVTTSRCNKLLKPDGFKLSTGMICTFNPGRGSCLGDDGGPMGCYDDRGRFRQVGIMSWGPSRMCSHGRSVFTRVSKYRDWINFNRRFVDDDDGDNDDDVDDNDDDEF